MNRSTPLRTALTIAAGIMLLGATALAAADTDGYVFAWPFLEGTDMTPRGGTTTGVPVTLAAAPDAAWNRLREPGLSKFERDRRAILAMAGGYRSSFDFLETIVFAPGKEPAAPYRSWGTEYIYVLADDGDFISLQHILCMFIIDAGGDRQGPFVVKHWRQDWRYQDDTVLEFVGRNRWRRRALDQEAPGGTWTQAVFQVDDSPRYESSGRWQHTPAYSSWQSATTRRPLPRREYSVRDDYDLLEGINRHTVLPGGWTHEQDNLKVVLAADGSLDPEHPYRARETGVNRYERIAGFDFSAADAYWQNSGPFWRDVRAAWAERLAQADRITIEPAHADGKLALRMLGYAADDGSAEPYDAARARAFIDEVLGDHIVPPGSAAVPPSASGANY